MLNISWINTVLSLLMIIINFLHQDVKWIGVNKNGNSRINLTFAGAIHP